MTDSDVPTLEVGFAIETGASFDELLRLQQVMDSTEGKIVADAARIEQATGGMVKLSGASSQISSFGTAATREMRNAVVATNQAERAGEKLVGQLNRQIETFGKTASEIRDMRVELRAIEAENRGLIELAARLRSVGAEMRRLEADTGRLPGPTRAAQASMQNLGFQVQDFAVQIVSGTSALRAFAMQAPQAAGALTGFGGTLGKVGNFLSGPWGIALTLGTTLLAGFAAEALETSESLDEVRFASNAVGDAQSILGGVLDVTTGKVINQSGALMGLARAQLAVARVQAQARQAEARTQIEAAGKLGFTGGLFASGKTLQGSRAVQNMMQAYLLGGDDMKTAQDNLDRLREKGLITVETFAKATAAVANFAVEGGNLKVYESAQRILDGVGTSLDKGLILKAPKATKATKDLTDALEKQRLALIAWVSDTRMEAQGNVQQQVAELIKKQREWGNGAPTLGDRMVQEGTDAAALKQAGIDNARDALAAYMADLDAVSSQVDKVAANMRDAFGSVGGAIGDLVTVLDEYRRRQNEIDMKRKLGLLSAKDEAVLRKRAALDQIGLFGELTASAKGFFKEGSDGYKALETAEKAFRAVELALSVRAMAQDAIETASSIAKSGARTATKAVEAVVTAISSLPFPLNLAAGAATIAALASIGVAIAGSFGGGGNTLPKANDGTGTVLGDSSAKSDSIRRAIDSLKEVDTITSVYARDMAASLRSIESQISGFAALLVRSGDINASQGVDTGFSTSATGKILSGFFTGGGLLSKLPIIGGIFSAVGGIFKSLFGTKTSVIGSGLFGGAQSLSDILSGGFDADYYSDIKKKKKFFGLTTGTKYSTQYSAADPELENQFTLILRQFNDAIVAAAGPLGAATGVIQDRLNSFVVNIGKIDLQGLTGDEIEEKLTAVFGAAADDMAKAAFPGIERFQQVGEGLFETLVRVASTVESVTTSLDMLGSSASLMSVDLKMALADQFESVSALTDAVGSYFETYYTKAEQVSARTAQMDRVFASLGLTMPGTLAAFRALVEAQDLTTTAGQATYATLLQLAPAFADLQAAMNGAKSAADILAERMDLERQLLELQGNTAAIRALDLAQLDESNRALQQQIWALQDAQAAAQAAEALREAWTRVGDSIMDEVNRIRGITDGTADNSFATLMGQFNAATAAARAGDQDAAGTLPTLSQSLLQAASLAATSRQELDRIKAQTAASLDETFAAVMARANGGGTSATSALGAAATAAQSTAGTTGDGDLLLAEVKALRAEVVQLRADNNGGHAATAGNTGAIKRHMDNVTAASGGDAIATVAA